MTSHTPLPTIAFLGLGAMGLCMSTHLYRSSFPLTGYDIYPPTLSKFTDQCAAIATESKITKPVQTASSPASAVKGAKVVVLMVATHHHVESALFDPTNGAVHGLEKGAVVIIAATVPPTYPLAVRKKLDSEFNRSDVALVDAPVSGGTARAVDGTLTIMASADTPETMDREDVKIVLNALAGNLYLIPGGLGGGTSAKALNQVDCGIHIVCSSEVMGVAAILGLDTQKFYDVQCQDQDQAQVQGRKKEGWSWMFSNRGARMLSRTPPMSSATAIIVKDVGIIMDETVRLEIALPMVSAAAVELKIVMDKGKAAEDDSCIVRVYLERAGVEPALAVERAGNGRSDELIELLCDAHACIHIVSAYETVVFSEALGMTSEEQRAQWFDIISGAAGGSTMFYEVVPALFKAKSYEDGVREFVTEKRLDALKKIISMAKGKGYDAPLLNLALKTMEEFIK